MVRIINFTKEGYKKVLEELDELSKRRIKAVENLRAAREMGDLSENGYYKAARQTLNGIDARIRYLTMLKRTGRIIEEIKNGLVNIGSSVTVKEKGIEKTIKIVDIAEADPSSGKISTSSPVGRELLGKAVGAMVEINVPAGKIVYEIIRIE